MFEFTAEKCNYNIAENVQYPFIVHKQPLLALLMPRVLVLSSI